VVFVTNGFWQGTALGGPSGADSKCQAGKKRSCHCNIVVTCVVVVVC
jgi:hypothetical protein